MNLRLAVSLCALLAIFAGCGKSPSPIGALGAMPQTSTTGQRVARGKSWMLPEAKSEKLVYIAANTVYVYAYGTDKLVGTIAPIGETGYECSDKKGNVFIPITGASGAGVYEYAHGGISAIKYFPVPGAHACSVDPLSGNLAVTDRSSNVYVFPQASGSAEVYTDADLKHASDVAYNGAGELFIDGEGQQAFFLLLALSTSTGIFQEITVEGSQNDNTSNPILWDGHYLGLGSYRSTKRFRTQGVVERLSISGSSARIAGYAPLGNQREATHMQFWTNGRAAIQPSNKPHFHSEIQYFKYPKGTPTKKFTLQWRLTGTYGITVSE